MQTYEDAKTMSCLCQVYTKTIQPKNVIYDVLLKKIEIRTRKRDRPVWCDLVQYSV